MAKKFRTGFSAVTLAAVALGGFQVPSAHAKEEAGSLKVSQCVQNVAATGGNTNLQGSFDLPVTVTVPDAVEVGKPVSITATLPSVGVEKSAFQANRALGLDPKTGLPYFSLKNLKLNSNSQGFLSELKQPRDVELGAAKQRGDQSKFTVSFGGAWNLQVVPQTVGELPVTLDTLTADLYAQKAETKANPVRISQITCTFDPYKNVLTTLTVKDGAELTQAKADVARLTQELADSKIDMNQAQQSLVNKEAELARALEDAKTKDATIAQLTAEKEELQKKLTAETNRANGIQENLDTVNNLLALANKDLKEKEAELAQANEQNETLTQQRDSLQKQVEQLNLDKQALERDKQTAEQNQAELQKQLDSLKVENGNLSEQAKSLNEELGKVREAKTALEQQNARLQQTIERLTNELDQLKRKNQNGQNDLATRLAEAERLRKDAEEAKARVNAELKETKAKLAAANTKLIAAEKAQKDSETKVNDLESKLQAAEAEANKAKAEAQVAREAAKQAKEKADDAQRKLDQKTAEAKRAQDALAAAELAQSQAEKDKAAAIAAKENAERKAKELEEKNKQDSAKHQKQFYGLVAGLGVSLLALVGTVAAFLAPYLPNIAFVVERLSNKAIKRLG
ncbi:hypothetical protein CMUST_13955 [Corynebacterium mustelae]|uniref:Uncharacterized protein n=1 Tax=Corynebacterium mustelae TaxID=571915 RepID=A0A0G3H0Z1_9CORY|nr:cell envelope integrity protein TolA [Corynebacterium mustelae]AKK07084.1 hypothetical protein CMUST_13955 [Corynebacterium mustelae]